MTRELQSRGLAWLPEFEIGRFCCSFVPRVACPLCCRRLSFAAFLWAARHSHALSHRSIEHGQKCTQLSQRTTALHSTACCRGPPASGT
eukprot:797845-Rhodomonas_salina.2